MKLYIAGKVGKNSQFGKHHWRDEFVQELVVHSGLNLSHLDPLAYESDRAYDPQFVFDKDCWLINQEDCVIVYLSDDISVGGSQEMLIAKYLKKPLIGLAPKEGKFNKSQKEHLGTVIKDYVDPFVYATCDVICSDVDEVSQALQNLPAAKTTSIIDEGIKNMENQL
jgi:hypothetical protein